MLNNPNITNKMEETKTRLSFDDGLIGSMVKMSDGNPGAATCLMELVEVNHDIDPQTAFGFMSTMISLDTHGIYGTEIYVLWKDLCEENYARMVAVMRAVQLGIIPAEKVKDAVSRQDRSGRNVIDVMFLCREVKKKLEEFDPENIMGL